MKISEIVMIIFASIGGVVGWNIGEHFFYKNKVENCHVIQQPQPVRSANAEDSTSGVR